MLKEKGFTPILIILGILVALGIGSGAYYLGRQTASTPQPIVFSSPSPAPDTTANWKAYTNLELGYSFNYPNDLTVKSYEDTSSSTISVGGITVIVMSKNYDSKPYVGISRAEYERALASAQLNIPFPDPETGRKFIKTGEKTIGGQTFTTFKVQKISEINDPASGENYSDDMAGIIGDKLYRFLLTEGAINDQILSTFKFKVPVPANSSDSRKASDLTSQRAE